MGAAWRPTDALPLAHPRVGNLVDTSFRPGTRDRLFTMVAASIVDDGVAVVLVLLLQLLAKPDQTIRRFVDRHSISLHDFAAVT
jgi:hypothetical protein